jgi:choline-sulfatase
MTNPANLVVLMSDQHNKSVTGCYGNAVVKTPNIDGLAARGTRFEHAYTPCPICVPARTSLATGRYPHQTASWDNAAPYAGGGIASWGHRLIEAGHEVVTVGKLHFRDEADDTGFPDQRLVMHVKDGVGDTFSLIRRDMPVRASARDNVLEASAGETQYTRYDRAIADDAITWLKQEAHRTQKPWVLKVSFVTPHPPLIAPPEFAALYRESDMPFPVDYSVDDRPRHPVLDEMRRTSQISDEFTPEEVRRALASYYALCSFMDAQVGRVLAALDETGLSASTRVIYTSDHGDALGDHGMWWKRTMYEGSVAIPMIIAGEGVPAGKVVSANVSLVDVFPTVLDATGVAMKPSDEDLPGRSLFGIIDNAANQPRTVFSEFHASGALTGFFMIRNERYKYVEYVGYPPQLYDLEIDPDERHDRAGDPAYAGVLADCARELRTICDPDSVNAAAFLDQTRRIEENGGEPALRAGGYKIRYSPAPGEFRI